MSKISCFIVTNNDEANIASCINCVKSFASEVIVVDTWSTDDTVKIAKSLGAKVKSAKTKSANFYAESLCQYDWILNLEPDEELSAELQREISIVSESGLIEKYKAYEINFAVPYYKRANKRKRGPTNSFVRLYNKNYAHYNQFGELKINKGAEIFRFIYPAYYKNDISVADFIERSGYEFSKIPFILRFFCKFFMALIIKKYFIFRRTGLIDSYKYAIKSEANKRK